MSADKHQSPLVGNFQGPQANSRRGEALQSKSSRVEQPAERDLKKDDSIAEEQEPKSTDPDELYYEAKRRADENRDYVPDRPLTPEELEKEYLKGLELVGVSQDKATEIMDNVLFHGGHQEDYVVCNRVKVGIGTRGYRDVQRAARLIEAEAPQIPMHVADLMARFNVAASLRYFGKVQFEPLKEDASKDEHQEFFFKKLDFVMSQPAIVIDSLINYTAEFDNMLRAVFSKGAPENF